MGVVIAIFAAVGCGLVTFTLWLLVAVPKAAVTAGRAVGRSFDRAVGAALARTSMPADPLEGLERAPDAPRSSLVRFALVAVPAVTPTMVFAAGPPAPYVDAALALEAAGAAGNAFVPPALLAILAGTAASASVAYALPYPVSGITGPFRRSGARLAACVAAWALVLAAAAAGPTAAAALGAPMAGGELSYSGYLLMIEWLLLPQPLIALGLWLLAAAPCAMTVRHG